MILWSTPKWVLVIGHYDNKFYIVIFKTAIKMAIILTARKSMAADRGESYIRYCRTFFGDTFWSRSVH